MRRIPPRRKRNAFPPSVGIPPPQGRLRTGTSKAQAPVLSLIPPGRALKRIASAPSRPRPAFRAVFALRPSAVPPPVKRLFGRSLSLLLSLRSAGGGAAVVFVEQAALVSGRGGSLYSVRQALKLGFFLVPAGQLGLYQARLRPAPQSAAPPPQGIAGPGLNRSRSPAAGRRELAGERYDAQTVSGPLSQAFWLGLNFNRQPGRVYQGSERPWGNTGKGA